MTIDIDKLLATLKAEKSDAEDCAVRMQTDANEAAVQVQILASRIQGIEEAMAAFSSNKGLPKVRRDIRALVKGHVEETGNRDPVALAEMIGCRVSQVKDALSHWPPPAAS